MDTRGKVSETVIRRLPAYYRYLEELEREGTARISSQELSARMGLTASQIRQDINCFGALGQQGYGYNIMELRRRIGDILGLDRSYHVIIIGAGNIGRAVANYPGFADRGFRVDALFDVREKLVGSEVAGASILYAGELSAYLQVNAVDIGVIAVPAEAAREVADMLMRGGVHALWNFAPVDIAVKNGFSIQNVQLTDGLMILAYHMNNG